MLELGGDHRSEIRKVNIFTFENILMTHGAMFTETVWNFILKGGCLIEMLRLSREMYNEQRGG